MASILFAGKNMTKNFLFTLLLLIWVSCTLNTVHGAEIKKDEMNGMTFKVYAYEVYLFVIQ